MINSLLVVFQSCHHVIIVARDIARKILQNLPWVRVPTRSPLLPPRPLQGCAGIADQQLGHHVRGFLQGDHVGACTPSGDARRGTFAVAPPPPCVLLPHIGSTNDHPRLLTSCRLSPIFPSSNSAPACTWPSSSRVLSSARRCAPPPPRSKPALPRVSPPTPVFPDSVQPGAVIFRAFPRANALAPAAPRVLPRRIPPLKASSSPRCRVALSRVLPDDPLPARSRDTFRPPASARNESTSRDAHCTRLLVLSRRAGREPGFRRHVGVAQQGEALQAHVLPRAGGVRGSAWWARRVARNCTTVEHRRDAFRLASRRLGSSTPRPPLPPLLAAPPLHSPPPPVWRAGTAAAR